MPATLEEPTTAAREFERICDILDRTARQSARLTPIALEPKGKHVIRLCDGAACHVRRSIPILNAIREKLNVDEKRKTTEDQLFTVETVECLDACGLAPVVVVDDEVYGGMTPERALAVIDEIAAKEVAACQPARNRPRRRATATRSGCGA
jgi:NADH:ubiquinone oxidoreductase subunit E